jgi:hypothetical protein
VPRLPILIVAVVVIVVAVLVDTRVSRPVPAGSPAPAGALAAPSSAESSSWYCAGAPGTPGGPAVQRLYLANTTSAPVDGLMTVVNSAGLTTTAPVTVPARGQLVAVPQNVLTGPWLAEQVDLDGGGVTVTEAVAGDGGWSVAPCASSPSSSWYFAAGSTAGASQQYLSLFNPTSTAVVVDLTFVTSGGVTQPAPFEGVVVAPGHLAVEPVNIYVQNEQTVATIVQARSGRLVVGQLRIVASGSAQGLSLLSGSPSPAPAWAVARSVDVSGGLTAFQILNPTTQTETVTVNVRAVTGPLAPLVQQVGPDATWSLSASATSRIPANVDYATRITSTGGPGVVVDRTVLAPAGSAAPQLGTVTGTVTSSTAASPSRRWLLAAPGTPAGAAQAGAAPLALGLENPGRSPVTVSVSAMTAAGLVPLPGVGPITLVPGGFTVIGQAPLTGAAADPLMVTGSGPVVVLEDLIPAGVAGVVSQPAIPLAG